MIKDPCGNCLLLDAAIWANLAHWGDYRFSKCSCRFSAGGLESVALNGGTNLSLWDGVLGRAAGLGCVVWVVAGLVADPF